MRILLAAAEPLRPADQLAQNLMDTGRWVGYIAGGVLALVGGLWLVCVIADALGLGKRKPPEE